MTSVARPRVVILGSGFGGLSAARALARVAVDVTLIDRHNYHLFQPLLYQVATAALAPNTIAAPVRTILRAQRNATVLMETVTGIDTAGPGGADRRATCGLRFPDRCHWCPPFIFRPR